MPHNRDLLISTAASMAIQLLADQAIAKSEAERYDLGSKAYNLLDYALVPDSARAEVPVTPEIKILLAEVAMLSAKEADGNQSGFLATSKEYLTAPYRSEQSNKPTYDFIGLTQAGFFDFDLSESLDAHRSSMPMGDLTFSVPVDPQTIHEQLNLAKDEVYVGRITLIDGEQYHLVLLPGDNPSQSWDNQLAWAHSLGGDLPTRAEQIMLAINCDTHFKKDWYWSSETAEGQPDRAWFQYFSDGSQHHTCKAFLRRARAVRRIAVAHSADSTWSH